jgi:hypothetical protein
VSATVSSQVIAGGGSFLASSSTSKSISSGQAVFDGLYFQGSSSEDHKVRFTATISGQAVSVDSAVFTLLHGAPAQFKTTSSLPKSISVGDRIPTINLQVLDAAGNLTTRENNLRVDVRVSSSANLSVTYSPRTVSAGLVSFSDIVVTGPVKNPDGSTVSFELLFYTDTFQSGNLSSIGVNGSDSTVDYSFDNPGNVASVGAAVTGQQVLPANTSFTVETWVKPDALTKRWNQIVHNRSGNNLARFDMNIGAGTAGSNTLQVIYNPETPGTSKAMNITPTSVPIGEWTHLAVTVQVFAGC